MKRLFWLLLIIPLSLQAGPHTLQTAHAGLLSPSIAPYTNSHHLRNFKYNTFVSMGVGPTAYFHQSGTGLGAGVDFSYGKWLLTSAGLRLQLSGYYAQGEIYGYVSLDYFFDPITAIKWRNPSNTFRTYLLMGAGLVHSLAGDNDFFATVGMGADMKVSDNWRLYAEMRCRIHPSDFDNNEKSSQMTSFMLGAIRDIAFNPTRSRAINETQQMENDWFFQVSLGVNSFNYKGVESFNERLSLLTPTFEFGLGKRLTTLWSVRMHFSGLYSRSSDELFSFYNARGDVMVDLASLFGYDLPVPHFSVQPYVGAGIVTRLDDQSHFLVAIAGGGQILYRPSPRNTVFLDARYLIPPPRFAHVETPQSTFSVGIATLTIGYSYTFSKCSFK